MGSTSQGDRRVVSGTAATVEGAPLKNAAPNGGCGVLILVLITRFASRIHAPCPEQDPEVRGCDHSVAVQVHVGIVGAPEPENECEVRHG
jgi:hypothetical protein